jgi:hypothetical protein
MEIHGNDSTKNQKILDTLASFGFEKLKGNKVNEQDVHCFRNMQLN